MNWEIVDDVPGYSREDIDAWVAEAEAGYDLTGLTWERATASADPLVPTDLLEAIGHRAAKDGETPADVVRHALDAYLHTA